MSCIDKTIKVYLVGKMSGLTYEQMNNWRVLLANRLRVAAENTGYKIVIINTVSPIGKGPSITLRTDPITIHID